MTAQAFHPDRNLPGCMMPDGGECCTGHAAVCEDWHKQNRRIEELTKALLRLDTLLDFSDENIGQTWTFEDTSSVQEAFAEAYRVLSVSLERSGGAT